MPPMVRALLGRLSLRRADARMTRGNVAQASVTVLVALALCASALLGAAADEKWQQSLRGEIKRSVAMVEDVRHVYLSEAPVAFELALSKARAAAVTPAAAVAEEKAEFTMRRAAGANGLISGDYEHAGGGYDLIARLADVRERFPDLVALDPDASLAAGDRRGRWALVPLVLTIPLVLGFLVVDVLMRRRTGRAAAAGHGQDDLGLVPRPWSTPGPRRVAVVLALASWLLITLLPGLQLHYANQEQRAQALAARKAAEVSRLIEVSGIKFGFTGSTMQRVAWTQMHATGQQLAANIADANGDPYAVAPDLRRAARAESRVGEHAPQIAALMTRPATGEDRLDPATRHALAATPREADAARIEQNREAARADRSGARAKRVTIAVLLSALAASLAALGAVTGARRPTLLDVGAAGVLSMALLALASVPFL